MKKLLLASAIAALSVSAQAAPQVYGKAFLTVDYVDSDVETTPYTATSTATTQGTTTKSSKGKTSLNSNASRIGIKGSEALTANTDVVYQLEYGVQVDNAGQNFTSRDTYLGLSNKQYGTLLAGRLSAIDGQVDYANVTQGNVVGGDAVLASFDSPRADNAFAYISPNYNGVTFLGMYALDSDKDSDAQDDLGNVEKFGFAAKYEPNGAPYRAGASYIQAGDTKITRVSGSYDVNPAITVGALYQISDYKNVVLTDEDGENVAILDSAFSEKENALTLSATYKTATPWTAYTQLDLVKGFGGAKDAEKQRLVVGGKYAFNKATTGHVYGAYFKDDKVIDTDPKKVSFVPDTSVTYNRNKADGFGIGAGLEYKF